jgi:hypothetical protein
VTNVLVLLQGTNPLPNLVVTIFLQRYGRMNGLAAPDQVIVLTSKAISEARAPTALKDVLGDRLRLPVRITTIENPDDGAEVGRKVSGFLATDEMRNADVHLDYTGGTKVMAVHAARAVDDARRQRQIGSATFSYLDAQSMRLQIEARAPVPGGGDLRSLVRIDMHDILRLHRIFAADAPGMDTLPLIGAAQIATAWLDRTGPGANFVQFHPSPVDPEARNLRAALMQDLRVPATCQYVQSGQISDVPEKAQRVVQRFLKEGRWLERVCGVWLKAWLYEQPGAVDPDINVKSVLANRPVPTPLSAENAPQPAKSREFVYRSCNILPEAARAMPGATGTDAEIDVLGLYGYQLIAVSCTATNKEEEAEKRVYEAWFRARQLGGEEARVLVASLIENPDPLNQRLKSQLGHLAHVHVLGRNDLHRSGGRSGRENFWAALDEVTK